MGTGKQLNTNELIAKLQELEKENARLRKILDVHGIPYVIAESTVSTKECQRAMAPKLSLQEKVALFRSVFQGREEVFAKRWYSPTTNKSGYQPVCEQNDVLTFVKVCKAWTIPYYIERSRSGNGGHVWIFFETPIAAAKARKLGNMILAEAMNEDARISFKSYDRFFPNQDTLPEGGLGNLVALPLQGKARRKGNSVFVDDNFQPYLDQWDVLQNIQRLDINRLEQILQLRANSVGVELSHTSEEKPWEMPLADNVKDKDFPLRVILIVANMLYIPLAGLSAKSVTLFKRIAAFRNYSAAPANNVGVV